MPKNLQNVKIFVASPGDVQMEREKVREIADKINETIAGQLGFHLDVIGWEQVIPDLGDRPQEIINRQIGPYDIFIGIMWKRFGTPTGKAESGTEEELNIAMECKEKCDRPRIMFYFNQAPFMPQTKEETEQMGKVIDLRNRLYEEGLVWTYTGCDNFAEVIDKHLSKLIVKWSQEGKEEPKPKVIALKPYFAHPYPMQENFTGRLKERGLLTEWLEEDPNPMLAIIAFGGMGKSALSWYWLHEDILKKGKKFDGVIWWSFYDKESSFDSFLDHAILYVYQKKIDPRKIKSAREKMDTLFEALKERNFLLVLDGLERILRAYAGLGSPYKGDVVKEDEKQDFRACIDPNAGTFLQMLSAGYPKTRTLITSRLFPKELDGIAGCRRVDLKRMSKEDAIDFFHAQGVEGTRAEIQEPCELLGYHPLSLCLLSGLIAQDPQDPGNIQIWKECCPNPEDLKGKEGHKILEIAYSALDGKKQEFVSKLAAFRTPMEFNAIWMFNKFGDKKAFKRALIELQNRGILFFDKEKKKYDLHPIVRSYCYDRLRDKEGVHSQLRDYFASVPEPEKMESIDDLQPVIELYHHTVGAGKLFEAWDMFYNRLASPLHFQFGAYQLRIELLQALFTEGEDKLPPIENISAQAAIVNLLANSYSLSGQPRRAAPLFQLGNDPDIDAIKEEFSDFNWEDTATYPRGEDAQEVSARLEGLAIGLGNFAYQEITIGDLESAESNLRRVIKLAKEVKEDIAIWQGNCELFRTMNYLGKYTASEKYFKDAEKAAIDANMVQWRSVNWAYRSLRTLLMDSPKEALKCANKALEFAKKQAEERYPVEADFCWAHWLLGASHLGLGDLGEAEKHLNEATQRDRKINLVEIEAAILLELAKLTHLRENEKEAEKLASEALEIANRCGYVLQQADIHLFLATFYKDAGDIAKAKEHAELAKLRSHQMIDVKTGDYITKPEDTKYKYKPCYDKAIAFLSTLENQPPNKTNPPNKS